MNINKLLKRVKDHLGMTKYLSTSYDDKAIYEIIVNHALADWSYYFRYEYEPDYVKFSNNDLAGKDLLTLPTYITDILRRNNLKIMDIKKVRFQNSLYGNIRNDLSLYAAYNSSMSKESIFAGQNAAAQQGDLDHFMNYRYSCWYEAPNKLRFNYPVMSGLLNENGVDSMLREANMSIFVEVDKNLATITPTREPYFIELCILHVMRVIYENEIKYMENIQSGGGNISLKVDEWASAGERLKEHLKVLEAQSTLSQHGAGII